MLLQALARYADSDLKADLADEAFETKPVPYGVEIDAEGRFRGVLPRFEEKQAEGGKKVKSYRVAQTLLIPKSPVNRNSGVYPLLGVDSIQYVVGPEPGVWTKPGEYEKHEKHHAGFVGLIREAAELSGDSWLKAACLFYDDPAQVAAARVALAAEKPPPQGGANVALFFSPGLDSEDPGGALVSRLSVKKFWRPYFQKLSGNRHAKGGEGICMISEKFGPIAVTHDKIKGASSLGGQAAGVALMSFDKQAFCSYGWEQNQNGPICPERATAYVLALNDLMHHGRHRPGRDRERLMRTRTDLGGMGFLYWTRDRSNFDAMKEIDSAADAEENNHGPDDDMAVADLLDSPRTGKKDINGKVANWFHLLTVSGNGGRLVVHDWHEDSLENVWDNILAWREGLQAPDVFHGGQPASVPSVYRLVRALMRPGMKEDSKQLGHWKLAMVRRALFGPSFPLGNAILVAALGRMRTEKGTGLINADRVGLIRIGTNDILTKKGKSSMPVKLDTGTDEAAYLCGRLLACYDYMQWYSNVVRELPPIKVTLSDRLFASASMRPGLVLPKVEQLGRHYLSSIRGSRPGYAVKLEKQVIEIKSKLQGNPPKYPSILNLEQQGCFSIGFHHQKAEIFAKKEDEGDSIVDDHQE